MTGQTLDVICFGVRAGTLTDHAAGLGFEYDPAWLRRGRPPLSQSLPLSGEFGVTQVLAYFGGLLPEGIPRQTLARQLGVSVGNDYGLLALLGGDTAGAVSLAEPGATYPGEEHRDRIRWLDEDQLAALIEQLHSRPMHAEADDGEFRLSLAGVQDKLPVVLDEDGRVGLTEGRVPSTHILKTPIAGLPDTIANEALCLELGRRLGIPTVRALPLRARATECLIVTRYDRELLGKATLRLHQEDFCQALGIPSDRKYETEGGPDLVSCFELLRRAAEVPARAAPLLLDYLALSFMVGNHDAHGKNYSLLYVPDSDRASLAPAYDILSTIVYRRERSLSRKLAMSVGGEYRPDYIRSRHLEALLTDAQLGIPASRRRLAGLAERAPDAFADARASLAGEGWDSEVFERIEQVVLQRAAWLGEIALR